MARPRLLQVDGLHYVPGQVYLRLQSCLPLRNVLCSRQFGSDLVGVPLLQILEVLQQLLVLVCLVSQLVQQVVVLVLHLVQVDIEDVPHLVYLLLLDYLQLPLHLFPLLQDQSAGHVCVLNHVYILVPLLLEVVLELFYVPSQHLIFRVEASVVLLLEVELIPLQIGL